MATLQNKTITKTTTTGHELSTAEQLDNHFLVAEQDYKKMLFSVGLKKGWHVLDAACGTGSFIPLIAECIGTKGQIAAMDLAPENIELLQGRSSHLACPVHAKVGDLTNLPYDDNTFDAVWCANAMQFLMDAELEQCFKELKRVLKPGGLVAIKGYDVTTLQIHPIDPFVMWRFFEGMKDQKYFRMLGMLRTISLASLLTKAGLQEVKGTSHISEWTHPLTAAERQYFEEFLQYVASLTDQHVSAPSDRQIWKALHQPQSPDNPLNSPDFYFRESHMVFVGQKPIDANATIDAAALQGSFL